MLNCKLCGVKTKGSTGAAGIKWPFICQPCKDKEDQALLRRVKHAAKILDLAATTKGESYAESKSEDQHVKVFSMQGQVDPQNGKAEEVSGVSEPEVGSAEGSTQEGRPMNPECCGREMEEIESGFINECGEYEVIGYECPICGIKVDLTGKEIG